MINVDLLNKDTFTGWYLFFTVIFLSVPLSYLVKETMSFFNILHSNLFIYFFFSISLTSLIFFFFFIPIFEKYFRKDIFLDKCKTCDGKIVFLTLKKDKAYIGILKDAQQRFIAIVPLISGGRDQYKKIKWTNFYNKENLKEKIEIIIPCKEIMTFGKYSPEILLSEYNSNNKKLSEQST